MAYRVMFILSLLVCLVLVVLWLVDGLSQVNKHDIPIIQPYDHRVFVVLKLQMIHKDTI